MSKHDNYLKEAKEWDVQIHGNLESSKNRAWVVAALSMGIAICSIICLMLLLPLKSYEPYVITIDKNTGYTQVVRSLEKGSLSEDQAITESNLVRYVSMRESYNPHILKENYKSIALMSDKGALQEFEELWSGENPKNPSKLLGHKGTIDVKIKSVSMLNDTTAQVRFLTEKRRQERITLAHFSAIVKFQYTQKPMKMIERFANPLGFQVISYRKSQELL